MLLGSGKTTLLNSMAGRMHGANIEKEGSIAFSQDKVSIGYLL